MKINQSLNFRDTASTNFRVRQVALLLIVLLLSFCVSAESFADKQTQIPQPNLIYTPDEMLTFDIEAFLKSNAPHLIAYSEAISHWSGRTSISPKIIIALLEHQSSLLSKKPSISDIDTALSKFSGEIGLVAQIEDVSTQLAEQYYKNLSSNVENPQLASLKAILESGKALSEQNKGGVDTFAIFSDTFFSLFPHSDFKETQTNKYSAEVKAIPPENLFQLPYPVGASWQTWGGTHTFNGQGNGPYSSLDFRKDRVPFGANTSNIWVSSASGGRVIRHSSCFVEVIGPGGWSTSYYHLDNVRVTTGQSISRNTRLANYADNLPQSLCNGGHSNGPHVHFSLKLNGSYSSLSGVSLSGYKVHPGRSNYDSNCNFFWLDSSSLTNSTSKICAGIPALNNGVFIPRPDLSVESYSAQIKGPNADQIVTASTLVENIGTKDSTTTQLSYLLSNDAGISFSDTLLATSTIEAIEFGSDASDTIEFAAPSENGQYWIGVCVVAPSGEKNISNNCSKGVEITVEENTLIIAPLILLLLDDD